MATSLLFLLLLTSASYFALGGKVRPYGPSPIILNTSNAGDYADYNFTMTLDTPIISDGIIVITFPMQQYDLGLGLQDSFIVYAPYPTIITCTLTTDPSVTEVYKQISCSVGAVPANQSFTITIIGVRNPLKVGGTGMFKIESIYGMTGKILDYNYAFGVIGIAPAATELANASIVAESGYSTLAGDITNWIINFSPVNDIQANIDIRIVFPPDLFDFTYAETYQCEAVTTFGYTLSGPIKCQFNTYFVNEIVFVGNNATIPKGSSVNLRMLDFYNPAQACTTDFLTIYILEQNTNNTIEYLAGVPGLVLDTGTINNVALNSPAYPLYINAVRTFVLEFEPSNPFNSVRIATAFPTITSCSVIYGLSLKDFVTPIVCTPVSNVMTIMGFATYQPENIYLRVVQVQFTATLPSIAQNLNPVEIYTYLDTVFLLPVDQNTTALNTIQEIVNGPASQLVQCYLTITDQTPSATTGVYTFTIEASSTLAATNIVDIEIDEIFYGIPICKYRPNGGSFASVTCTYSDGVIQVNLGTYTIISAGGSANNQIQITGFTNPYATGTYTFRIDVYGASSTTATNYGTNYFTINSVGITTATAALLARRQNRMTPLLVSFTTPVLLYDGYQLTSEPFKVASEVDIHIYMTDGTNDWFYYDLGYSLANPAVTLQNQDLIPCQAITGFAPSTFASTISCDILLGPTSSVTTSSYVTVRVRDFTGVLPGTSMKIAIPVYNEPAPATASNPKMDIVIYYRSNCQEYLIASTTITSTNMVVTSGTPAALAFSAALTAQAIQSTTTLTLTFSSPAVTATADNSLVVFYPNGFIMNSNTVMTLAGTTVPTSHIVYYNTFLFFTILLPSNLAASTHTLVITNVDTPFSQVTANSAEVGIASAYDYVSLSSAPIALTAGTFDQTTGYKPFLDVLNSAPNHPYATYTFSFTTTLAVTSADMIVVTFPSASYNFAALTTPPYPASFCNLTGLSVSSPVTGTCSGTSCTVTSFQSIPIGTSVAFSVYGVTNPGGSINGEIFVVSTQDSSSNVIETANLVGNSTMVSGTAFSTQNLNVTEAQLIPNNAIVFGIMSFFMNPGFALPKYSSITITFPSGFTLYSDTVTDTECLADGGLYSIISCVTPSSPGLSIVMQTGDISNASIPITLYYVGYSEYDTAGTTVSGWTIKVTYQGVTIASSGSVGSFQIGSMLTGDDIIDVDLNFYPQNEGEQANYYFTFYTTLTSLTTDMMFFIRFPTDYDPQLCLYNLSVTSSDLQGALHGFLVMRDLRITGFNATTVTGPITIRVWGVVNPNRYDNTRTGYFVGGIVQNTVMLQGNDQILGIIPLLAPGSISLTSLSTSDLYARYQADYTFTFQIAQSILSSQIGGVVYIDFPPDYIIDSYGGNCTINQAFSFFVNCAVDNNRITLNATNNEWTVSDGPLTLSIYDVNGPDNDGWTFAFVISNYDSLTMQVLGRTYSTLNPASFYYTYDGAQIHVNYDQPVYVEVGTYTDEIYITLDSPSVQSLTLTPNVLSPLIIFDVFPLEIGLGQTSVSFRVAAPRYILLQTYYIQWAKTGDAINASYAPLRRTPLVMVSGVYRRTVEFESIEYVPQGGISYPLAVFTNNPPYNGLTASLTILDGDTLAYFNQSVLNFVQEQSQANYMVSIDPSHPLTTVQIQFSLSGFDSASYTLPVTPITWVVQSILTIPVYPPETTVPYLTNETCVDTTRIGADFSINGTSLAFVYYVYGNIGMLAPPFNNVQNQTFNQTLNYSNPVYGVTYIKNVSMADTFSLSGLTPGISYTIYFYIMNLNRIYNPQWYQVNFTTASPDKPASFVMMIAQSNVSSDLIDEWLVRMAAMISIDNSRVIQLDSDCLQTQLSLSYSAPNTTFIQVCILPDLTNTNTANSPFNLVDTLNSRVDEIVAFIPNLSGDLLQREELPDNIPTWVGTPKWIYADTGSLALTAKVDYCGWILAVACPVALSTNNTASNLTVIASASTDVYVMSYQIFSQLNFTNLPAINTSVRVSDATQQYTLNLSGLADKLIYHIYITTMNDWPANNELLPDSSVQRIEAKTLKIRKPLNIFSANWGAITQGNVPVILTIIILLLAQL